jgi:hypothetical protein
MCEVEINIQMGIKSRVSWRTLGFTLFWLIAITGCTSLKDPEVSQEYKTDIVGTINPGNTIGQTIIHRR